MRLPKKDRPAQSPAHKHAPQQEKAAAKRLGGRTTPGSGNGREKGDVRVKGIVRVENKGTSKKSFSVTREMVAKIEGAALPVGEVPVIEIDFLTGDSVESSVAVVPLYVVDRLVELEKENQQRKH